MWQCNKNAWIGRDYPIYSKIDKHKHTLYMQCVHILSPILWLAEPADGFLHIQRFTLSLFLPIFLLLRELLMLTELSGSINNFAISKNTPSLPARCLESFQEKEKKTILVNREKGPHWNVCTPIFTLVINHYLLWHWLIGLPQILQNSYENPG